MEPKSKQDPSRRALLSMVPGSLSLPLVAQAQQSAAKPFRVAIPQKKIDRILARVRDAQWPDRLDADDWRYGANWDYLKELAAYWVKGFDWRKAEARLNAYPQFLARVDDYDIHFYHVKGKGPRPMPLMLTHGWPGSVFEFLDVIGPLTEDFDVVIPSLPGFGFSSKPKGKPVGPVTTARLWHKLMKQLGYTRFGAQGGDWGQAVTIQMAHQSPESLIGIHLNATGGAPPPEAEQTEEERAWARAAAAHGAAELDYFREQQRKPQTVSFALSDSPLGAAAWMIEKFKVWSDSGNNIESAFTKDQLLTNVMIYLVTDTAGTGVWFYRGSADDGPAQTGKVTVPTGFASFPKEMPALNPPRSIIARNFSLKHYTKMPKGGHFACLEQPQLFVADVREFFRG